MPSVAIIGASRDRSKYGNKSLRAHAQKGYRVYPIHPTEKEIEGHPAYRSVLDIPEATLDRVSFYVPPEVGLKVIEEVAKKKVKEVWLNPGAESPELVAKAEKLGIEPIQACSIVALGTRPSDFT